MHNLVRLNLRQTIVIGIAIFTLAFGGIGLLSLSNINQLQQEVVLVERADDLRNLILEIRREEKNFFLYMDRAFFSVGRENLERAWTALDALTGEIGTRGLEHGESLAQGLVRYGELLDRLGEASATPAESGPAAQALRETGQELVEHSRAIAELERATILRINRKLRLTLIVSMGRWPWWSSPWSSSSTRASCGRCGVSRRPRVPSPRAPSFLSRSRTTTTKSSRSSWP